MEKFPEYLNTKFDYDYVREHFPIRKWLPVYEELIRDYKKWQKTKVLKLKTDGKEDKDNKIIEEKDAISKETTFLQYEYKFDPNCKIKRLGMDIAEVEKIVSEAKNKIAEKSK